MSATSALSGGRTAASRLMLDAGKALRPTGGFEYVGGVEVQSTAPLFGPVPCKIKPSRTTATQSAQAGGRTLVTVPAELHLPADPDYPEYAELTIGDVWETTGLGPMSLSRVGRRYRITGEVDGSLLTACRYTIERAVS